MKKSKVIIPAMALLLFSTAASITGTVAWFTSNRVFNTSAGEFTAKSIDGNLDVDLAGGVGTKAVLGDSPNEHEPVGDEKATKIKVDANSYLIDGSVDVNNQTAWRLSRTAAGNNSLDFVSFEGPTAVDDNNKLKWLYREETGNPANKYYVAMSWTLTFNYTFATETKDVGIYLDLNKISMTAAAKANVDEDKSGGNGKDISKGFRIGFKSSTHWRVWGNNPGTLTNTTYNLTYVDLANHVEQYTSTNYIYRDGDSAAFALATDGEANASTRLDRIATITKASANAQGKGSIAVTCFAWFEGTDPNVVSETAFKTLSANMYFYARSDA